MTFIRSATQGPRKIFEWNKIDTSQFELTYSSGGGSPSPTLTTTTVTERGLALVPSSTGTTGITSIFLAKEPIPYPDERRDMRFEMELFDITGTTPIYCGFCVLGDDVGSLNSLHHFPFGPLSWGGTVQAGSLGTAPDNGVSCGLSGWAAVEMRGRKPAGATPEISLWCHGAGTVAGATGSVPSLAERRTGQTVNTYGANEFRFNQALDASWNSRVCNRWGIAVRGDSDLSPKIGNVKAYLL